MTEKLKFFFLGGVSSNFKYFSILYCLTSKNISFNFKLSKTLTDTNKAFEKSNANIEYCAKKRSVFNKSLSSKDEKSKEKIF